MSNLLDKASIILTPTAYDDGKVLAAKPSEAPYGDFDFTRNSSATRVNAQGLVEDVQILSSNLVQNGDFSEIGSEEVTNGNFSQEGSEQITNGSFATDSDWTKGTGWSIGGGTANCDGTQTSNTSFYQAALTLNKTYKFEFTISDITSGQVRLRNGVGDSETYIGYQNAAGTFTAYAKVNGNTILVIDGDADFIGSIDNVSVKEVGQDWTLGTGWSI